MDPHLLGGVDKKKRTKRLMRNYMDDLVNGRKEKFVGYFDGNNYIQHNPLVADNLAGLLAGFQALAKQGLAIKYTKVHQNFRRRELRTCCFRGYLRRQAVIVL